MLTPQHLYSDRRQIIAALLHHLLPLFKVRGPVECPSVRIVHGMRELVLDIPNPDVENFVKDRAGHCPESVAGHLVLAVHAAQRTLFRFVLRERSQVREDVQDVENCQKPQDRDPGQGESEEPCRDAENSQPVVRQDKTKRRIGRFSGV